MKIQATVTSEGSTYNVRFIDNYGLGLPAFVCEFRYDGVHMQHDTALFKAYAVRDYINTLSDDARQALYQHHTA